MHLWAVIVCLVLSAGSAQRRQNNGGKLKQLWEWWVMKKYLEWEWVEGSLHCRYQAKVDTGGVACDCGPVEARMRCTMHIFQKQLLISLYGFMRGFGRDLAKLGEKLHQLEMAMGEFSLQQVKKSSSHISSIFLPMPIPKVKKNKCESCEMRKQNLWCLVLFSQQQPAALLISGRKVFAALTD